ncbi:beta-ketoacyl synthase [Saccharospirillum salsuginis]|uniref:Beta-ketoacyl-[acyl-carrier-protein] synthase FabY n=1 Tax=Saccharospirillum salsuginis TaxID=418750 RepID=A0A918K5V8_9GAMM|nr:beta-ketoacyl synthase [Saccharospirillum salsuginis]GGX51005.1 beta-ketoacyl-[acyl-carrier-protein] synthase FabY [Saccharospirillum salsuginis]
MKKLPVIVGFGGINAAGRVSMHHGYRRMVHEALDDARMAGTWEDLATLMRLKDSANPRDAILAGTLIRRIEAESHYDPAAVPMHRKATLNQPGGLSFHLRRNQLPETMPAGWTVEPVEGSGTQVRVTVDSDLPIMLPDQYVSRVSSAGTLPTGFNPADYYNAAHHPRGLQMAVYGASDAIQSMGVRWEDVLEHIHPDQVSVYAGSAVSQMDQAGLRGLYQNPMTGNRITSKMMPLALPEMAADFVNSYILNSVGNTGSNAGACATFLYNLRQGLIDIEAGKCRVAVVGNSEAPVVPEIMEGFRIMGALAEDEQLKQLDQSETADNRRACRPFSSNAGFTMAESSQFMVLMDDELALQLGATVYGSVADVFVNADANKKSISGPGVGNYITMAKATALARAILGDDGLQRTFVMAHGTGTPQNRVTESHIFNEIAQTFGIDNWAVSAIKSYLGHSLGPAAADQLNAALGVWSEGFIPGIRTIDHIADDVHRDRLNIAMNHLAVGEQGEDMLGTLINSKGFGGNNASALVLSPNTTRSLMQQRHGEAALTQWQHRNETVQETQAAFDARTRKDGLQVMYSFGESVMTDKDVQLDRDSVKLSRFSRSIQLPGRNPFV